MINGTIQSGSQLNYTVSNRSTKTIKVLTMQMVDGSTGDKGNPMEVNQEIAPSSSASWTYTVGLYGIHSPTAIFVYSCEGKRYETSARYVNF